MKKNNILQKYDASTFLYQSLLSLYHKDEYFSENHKSMPWMLKEYPKDKQRKIKEVYHDFFNTELKLLTQVQSDACYDNLWRFTFLNIHKIKDLPVHMRCDYFLIENLSKTCDFYDTKRDILYRTYYDLKILIFSKNEFDVTLFNRKNKHNTSLFITYANEKKLTSDIWK